MAVLIFVAFLVILLVITPLTAEVKMPPQCKDMTYCPYKGDNYPDSSIKQLHYRNKLPTMVFDQKGLNDISHRSGVDDITRDLCPSKDDNATIYYIVDTKQRTREVVQLKGVFSQRFSLQICVTDVAQPFSPILKTVIKDRDMYCENIHYQYEFIVLSEDRKRLEKAYNLHGVPVWCACKYRNSKYTRNGNFKTWNQDI